ncbi:SDR family NAD(P)-dependent oxidoreductase [Desulfolutivibrio sulfoxidireducens]|uniref:SDR family NAD(P)-dependent oxidoreductase n=1 Tax=Desulfolutivibrio sulfoxidireducens TaxID=2773299 RepID=UPI00159D45A7|nr:SDR family NAD(P)-dependent oxidoreductase [Desulfolutivibrio sulfoxidireducens]QLA17052.1 SDR family NAD(P)-dependent oxidoreductase [Desulfolutivibrio sulfoxidireducens]QLA20620.1 SDR family NAD(P)-dependent oxidoreductase [Desulfolutivibrio sulfoxidireducens]
MEFTGKRCLVTGAGGFIGSHLVERLVRAGNPVRALVRYCSSGSIGLLRDVPEEIAASVEIVSGDVRDAALMAATTRGVDVVFHLAALIGIPYSYAAAESYVDTNVKGTLNVLQAALCAGASVVHTSTSEVYGTADFVPITEEHPLKAQSPYAASKIAADQLALSFHHSFDLPVTVVRPFNTFGPRQSPRAVIPSIILQMLRGGETLRLGALHPTRDFCFVEDTVAGFLSLAASKEALGEVVNIGTGHEYSIAEVARLIGRCMGRDVAFAQEAHRLRPEKSEVERLLAGVDKARRLAGWQARYAGPENFLLALRKTIEWFSQRLELPMYAEDFRL